MNRSIAPIGFFDSGVGGTSIWREVHHRLPMENTIYLADSAHAPYGIKTKEEIIELSIKNTTLLIEMGCKMIVVACNTATTNAIATLRAKFDIPFIGIEPAIKPAANESETKRIGILATKGTIHSDLFSKAVERYPHVSIIEQIGTGLVELIENGEKDSLETFQLLEKYIKPMLEAHVDYIVLGCSHYPYLMPQIRKIVPHTIAVIDSGEAVARQTENILRQNQLLGNDTNANQIFYTNGQPEVLQELVGVAYEVKTKVF